MTTAERVSVIIPVYNGERYLGEALESVVGQTLRPSEVIVVNDGSTDGSGAVAAGYDPLVRCLRQEHGGIGAARNRGAQAANGDYLAFLDADDLWEREKLALQLAEFRKEPRTDAVFGYVDQFISPDLSEELRATLVCPNQTVAGLHAGAMLIRRGSFLKVGFFVTEYQVGEFLDWYARAQAAGLKMTVLPEVLMRRRIHGGNHILRHKDRFTDYAFILKAAIDRKRRALETDDE